MALQELERKLAESFDGLREENKSLIDLLKQRQHLLKSSLGQGTSSDYKKLTDKCHPLLRHTTHKKTMEFNSSIQEKDGQTQPGPTSEQPPLVSEGQQRLARHKLAQCTSQAETSSQSDYGDIIHVNHMATPVLCEGNLQCCS